MPDGEVGRIALPVIPVFFSDLECGHVRARQNFTFVTAAVKDRADQRFMFPSQAAKQDGDVVTLLGGERVFFRFREMLQLHQPRLTTEPGAFRFESPRNIFFGFGN